MSNPFLIIGSTGNIGSSLVEILLQRKQSLCLATRNPDKTADTSLSKTVFFDFDQPDSWQPALAGIRRIFMIPKVGDPFPDQTLIPFMDAAKKSGVEHIVFSTAMGLDKDWRVLAFAEEYLQQLGVNYTILRPGWFAQNFTSGFMSASIKKGVIALPGSSNCQLSIIDTRDIAACAAAALSTDDHINKTYTLTGPESLSWTQITALLSTAAGYDVRYMDIPEKHLRDALLSNGTSPYRVEQMILMMRSMRDGIFSDVTSTVEDILGRPAISLQQHLTEFGHYLK